MMDSVNAYNDKDDLSSTSEIIRRFTLKGLNHRHLPAKIYHSQQKLDNFNTILRETRPDEKVVEDYLIDVIAPQIHYKVRIILILLCSSLHHLLKVKFCPLWIPGIMQTQSC